jgi:hypothetical protein
MMRIHLPCHLFLKIADLTILPALLRRGQPHFDGYRTRRHCCARQADVVVSLELLEVVCSILHVNIHNSRFRHRKAFLQARW